MSETPNAPASQSAWPDSGTDSPAAPPPCDIAADNYPAFTAAATTADHLPAAWATRGYAPVYKPMAQHIRREYTCDINWVPVSYLRLRIEQLYAKQRYNQAGLPQDVPIRRSVARGRELLLPEIVEYLVNNWECETRIGTDGTQEIRGISYCRLVNAGLASPDQSDNTDTPTVLSTPAAELPGPAESLLTAMQPSSDVTILKKTIGLIQCEADA